MNDKELLENIKLTVDNSIKSAFEQLGIAEKVKPTENPFKRVEQILWNYDMFNSIIKDKTAQIEEIRKNGVATKSKSILEYNASSGMVQDMKTEEEAAQAVIEALNKDITWVLQIINRINLALETVQNSPDYPILYDYYFGGNTLEKLGIKYKMDWKTAAKRKNNLVRKIAAHLFPKESLNELVDGIA